MNPILQTNRLTIRQLTTGDTAFIIELLNTPGWLQFIGDRNVRTTEEAISYLTNGPLKSYAENGFGLYLVATKADDIPIGMCGILKRATLDNPDIGYALLPAFAGMGYAYEMANAVLNYALQELKLPSVCAITLPVNASSIKLLAKLGLKNKGPFVAEDTKETLLLFQS
ncbi:GNAT family N-acetyltransferase [Mucilaginibacter pankratovii]|uniref:GNAT family N-acetyltransferase n=1 Tax=Mucilaginibacter pankratovii TaxID=2772110 RepID=UPI001CD11006|nr:GNAT family N-acetyltransferase [Mucilaginibacter pankratovii]